MVYYSNIDRYWEVFCGKGDTIEIPFPHGEVHTVTVFSCSISSVECGSETSSIFTVSRKSILSMAHTFQQMGLAEIDTDDIVSIVQEDSKSNIDLGVVTKITGNLASIFYLTGALKNNVCDVWVKRLSFIGRGFSLETYFKLKESKLSLEYHSLYTYQNTDLIPQRFQQEMGIPKLVYDIGGKFPIVASLSGKLAASRELKSHDDSECITSSKSKRNKKSNLRFFSFEGHSDSYHVSDPFSKENGFPFMLKTYQNTKEQLVKVWLNINEKVSSRSKLMKQKTNEMYVNSEEISISSNELPSNQYLKTINVSRGDYARYEKSLIRKCPSTRHLNYTNRNVRLQPIPIISDPSTSEKKVRFCVNVLCHEYSPRV